MISIETLKKTIQISSLAKAKDLARAEAAMATTRPFFVLDAGGSIAEFYDKHRISHHFTDGPGACLLHWRCCCSIRKGRPSILVGSSSNQWW